MKRIIAILIISLVAISCVFAYQNTFNCESKEYKDLVLLYNLSDKALLNLVSPISSEQILSLLNELDITLLPNEAKTIYSELKNNLEKPEVNFKLKDDVAIKGNLELSLEAYKQADYFYDWLLKRKDRKPFIFADTELFFNNYSYGYFSFDLSNAHNGYVNGENYYNKYVNNLGFLDHIDNFDYGAPHRAFLSLGFNNMNLIVGRDKLNLGRGNTGNLFLSDTLWYNDFAKFSILNYPLNYDFTIVSYENSRGSSNDTDDHINHPLSVERNTDFKGLFQVALLHHLSYQAADYLSISFQEGALVYGQSIFMDLRKANPFFIIHNIFDYASGYNSGNMNNFFGIEVNAKLKNQWNLDAQVVVDQIQNSAEQGQSSEIPQSAFGLLLNAEKSFIKENGIGTFFIEGLYTSPNLYLKEKNVDCNQYWNLDLFVCHKINWPSDPVEDVGFIGHEYGPDTIAIATGFTFDNLKDTTIDVNFVYKNHGERGALFYQEQIDQAILISDGGLFTFLTEGVRERRFTLNGHVNYKFSDCISFDVYAGYYKALNYLRTNKNDSDVQLALGVTIKPLNNWLKTINL